MSDEQQIKADIEATRAELAETADLLAAKLDETAQVGKRVGKQVVLGITGAAVLIVIVQRVRISRRNRDGEVAAATQTGAARSSPPYRPAARARARPR